MNKLMKRYEAETGEIATWNWHDKEFVTDDYVAWLEAQLTWRPVSEPPKEDGDYLCRWEGTRRFMALYKSKMWFIWDGELEEYIKLVHLPYMWLPIPPAPEGEVK